MIGRPRGPALLLGGVVAAVLAVVGLAVAVLDSPSEMRRRRLDEQRIDDLQALADAVDHYWTREKAVPPDLDTLATRLRRDVARKDPATGVPYQYRPTGDDTFELCATFETAESGDEHEPGWWHSASFWHHPAGRHCFQLEANGLYR